LPVVDQFADRIKEGVCDECPFLFCLLKSSDIAVEMQVQVKNHPPCCLAFNFAGMGSIVRHP
jgi:hypothetical protein